MKAANARTPRSLDVGVCQSRSHTNYAENEKILKKAFANSRVENGELFSITVDSFLSGMPTLTYLDESESLSERGKAVFEFMKDFATGRYNERSKI